MAIEQLDASSHMTWLIERLGSNPVGENNPAKRNCRKNKNYSSNQVFAIQMSSGHLKFMFPGDCSYARQNSY
jgi:hypothetical protein